MRGAIGGILTIKRADREDNASSASNDDGETWHTQSAEKMEIYLNLNVELILRIFLSGSLNKRSSLRSHVDHCESLYLAPFKAKNCCVNFSQGTISTT